MKSDDEFFVSLMKAVIAPYFEQQMTDEQAEQEAIADHRTEQQAAMMGIGYECL